MDPPAMEPMEPPEGNHFVTSLTKVVLGKMGKAQLGAQLAGGGAGPSIRVHTDFGEANLQRATRRPNRPSKFYSWM